MIRYAEHECKYLHSGTDRLCLTCVDYIRLFVSWTSFFFFPLFPCGDQRSKY
uniref:Uncharacterized protein n=1 Tax=Arundo donax TaxID=35708 RepID=A0A0A9GQ33_ARUDO